MLNVSCATVMYGTFYLNHGGKNGKHTPRANKAMTEQTINMVDYSSVSMEIRHGRRPGKIDQSDILSGVSKTSLCSTIFQNQDYVIINKKMWDYLYSWYGGGPAIERYVVKDGNRLELELHPVTLRISMLDCNKPINDQLTSIEDNSTESKHAMAFLEITVSRFQTAAEVKRIACRHFGLRNLKQGAYVGLSS